VKKNSLFFESNKFVTISRIFSFCQKNSNYPFTWKKSSFQNILSFSGKFPLLSFTKTIHSQFRGNLPLKSEKIVPKMEAFFLFSGYFPFEKKILSSVKSKNFFFEEIRKITQKTE
jgi:hypothetical protein